VLDGTLEDAKRAAEVAAENVLSHLDPNKRAELLALLKPWWRPIPAGSFDMGSSEDYSAKPIHRVTFTSGYQMLGVPVTWAMYRLFDPGHDAALDPHEGRLPIRNHDEVPVYNVSWYAAVMFAEWLGARLPLEPEWEYACRAGTKTRFWSGDTDEDLMRVGWIDRNSDGHVHPVAQKPENPWGLHDVHGNVLEWCLDGYNHNAYNARACGLTVDSRLLTYSMGDGSPQTAVANGPDWSRVVRGAAWCDGSDKAHSAWRTKERASYTRWRLGFRLLLCPPDPP
jgi:formylglycine-generating enzyme required for sulfatase activity